MECGVSTLVSDIQEDTRNTTSQVSARSKDLKAHVLRHRELQHLKRLSPRPLPMDACISGVSRYQEMMY